MSTAITTPAKPTRLIVEKNDKDEMTKGRIENVVLAYAKMQDGELAYGSQTEREYTVNMVVTEQTAKDYKSVFPKNGSRALPNEQFTKSFRIDPPYPEQSEQHVIKLKASTAYNNDIPQINALAGDLVPYEAPSRPKVFEIVDGKPVDITMTTRIGNGSRGTVAFRVTNNKFGTFPTLSGVLVTDLIEQAARASIESDFGITADTPSTHRSGVVAALPDSDYEAPNDITEDPSLNWL